LDELDRPDIYQTEFRIQKYGFPFSFLLVFYPEDYTNINENNNEFSFS